MKFPPQNPLFFLLVLALVLACKSSPSGNDGVDPDLDLNGYNETGFFKTDGSEILNRQGNPVVIKGFGLGGWLLPEGYMFRLNREGYTSASNIYENVADLIGNTDAETWIQMFRDNYVQEADIIQIKEWGADHIRVPFHYNLFYDIDSGEFIDEGFDRIDQLLIWCKRQRMDVILDMHAAPGAQSEGDIADSDGEARLWTEYNIYAPIAFKIWEEIARKYKDETIIIGYDLLNEPVTPDGHGATDLLKFYEQIIPRIREIDQNHILFIEGNYWATTFDLLFPDPNADPPRLRLDDNMVYAFHKYWNQTDYGTIGYLINIRSAYNVPLWLGESGENSNSWFHETISLVESNNIGWNWWTHKKLETITSPLSSSTNENYDKVVEYWNGNSARPTAAEAKQGLFQMAEDLKIENNTLRPDVVAALFSPSFSSSNTPYTSLTIPGEIEAVHYDIGTNRIAYFDADYKRVDGDEEQNQGNRGWEFRNDGVDIESSDDPDVDYNVGFIETGEWLEYTVEVTTSGSYEIFVRVASATTGGRIRLVLDGEALGNEMNIPNTGGYQNWLPISLGTENFTAGTHVLRMEALSGGFNLNLISFR